MAHAYAVTTKFAGRNEPRTGSARQLITMTGGTKAMAIKTHSEKTPKRVMPKYSAQQLATQYAELRCLREAVRKAELTTRTVRVGTDRQKDLHITTH
jgi:hypothetical protein